MFETSQIITTAATLVIAFVLFLAKDWLKFRISGGKYMTIDACAKCQAKCQADMKRELDAGDKSFQEIKHDISTMKSAMVGVGPGPDPHL